MKKDSDDDLPRALRTLWRHADGKRRAPTQRLTLERIVAAAIEIAVDEGLPALSMAHLAERLGCATMSLYRHVTNKDELHALMMDVAPGAPPDIDTADWRDGLTQWAHELRAVYFRHPWMLQIAVAGPPQEPGQLAWLDCGLRALARTRLSPTDKLSVIMLVLHYVRGEAQLATTLSKGRRRARRSERAQWTSYARTLAKLIDPERFPAIAELIAADAMEPSDGASSNALADFDFGIARIVDGVEALIALRARRD